MTPRPATSQLAKSRRERMFQLLRLQDAGLGTARNLNRTQGDDIDLRDPFGHAAGDFIRQAVDSLCQPPGK